MVMASDGPSPHQVIETLVSAVSEVAVTQSDGPSPHQVIETTAPAPKNSVWAEGVRWTLTASGD